MTTPLTRASFLKRLALLAAAPFVAARLAARPSASQGGVPFMPRNHDPEIGAALHKQAFRVQGVGVEVPSNRCLSGSIAQVTGQADGAVVTYHGDWDGRWVSVRGVDNPSFLLRHLRTKRGIETDWVFEAKERDLDQAFVDYGIWCDTVGLHDGGDDPGPYGTFHSDGCGRRFTVNAVVQTPAEEEELYQTLRMHFLSWKSQDERYRTSWPGISHPSTSDLMGWNRGFDELIKPRV